MGGFNIGKKVCVVIRVKDDHLQVESVTVAPGGEITQDFIPLVIPAKGRVVTIAGYIAEISVE